MHLNPLMKPICGAKTRRGTPCQRKLLLKGGRCPNHGGLSTGPRTPERRLRSAQAIAAYWSTPEARQKAAERIRRRLLDPEWVEQDQRRREARKQARRVDALLASLRAALLGKPRSPLG